jgi:hypothetical protein
VHVTFSIPQLYLNSLEHLLTSISIAGDELRYAVVITASFSIREQGVDGRILIVLGGIFVRAIDSGCRTVGRRPVLSRIVVRSPSIVRRMPKHSHFQKLLKSSINRLRQNLISVL